MNERERVRANLHKDIEELKPYMEYLERIREAYPNRTPLDPESFKLAEAEWRRDYSALWQRIDTDPEAWAKIQRLEYLLAV